MSKLRETPFYRALHRQQLIFGGDRRLMLMVLGTCLAMMFVSFSLLSFSVGLIILPIAVYGLRKMAKADPQMWDVFLRQNKYAGYYPPFSRPWRASKTKGHY